MARSSQDTDLSGAWGSVGKGHAWPTPQNRCQKLSSLVSDSTVTKVVLDFPLRYTSFYRATLGNLGREKRGRNDWQVWGIFLFVDLIPPNTIKNMLSIPNFWAQSQQAGKSTKVPSMWEPKLHIERLEWCHVSTYWVMPEVSKRRNSFGGEEKYIRYLLRF